MAGLIIYDFDGVIADSEVIGNTVLAEMICALGHPTTLDDAYRLYMGKRLTAVVDEIERAVGHPLPPNFASSYQRQLRERFGKDLQPVDGVFEHIEAFVDVPRCIASSSSPDRLALSLEKLNLKSEFGANVFSASLVALGKPHPDIFLYAAKQMGVAPTQCIVLEDSPTGVEAGIAAGMAVIGLLAGSHIRDGHRERLAQAGAHFVAGTYKEAEQLTRRLLAQMPA
ncbi:MAG: HAD family hydrolase [Alphaproteobacteria bacterium]